MPITRHHAVVPYDPQDTKQEHYVGLTIRHHATLTALQGLLANPNNSEVDNNTLVDQAIEIGERWCDVIQPDIERF